MTIRKSTRRSIPDRFWAKVQKSDGCWLWTGGRAGNGYGAICVHRRRISAHRLSYELFVGDIGPYQVCHRCDTPLCVRPDHLFLGTNADNSADRKAKNRQARGSACAVPGERNAWAKLTESQVREIYALPRTIPLRVVAEKYGISAGNVSMIRHGKAWKHLFLEPI